jgi:hypothetical protein
METTDASSRATLPVRLIRNFEHRSMKQIVLHDVDLNMTTEQFEELIRNRK